jgi:hypothetical protein
MYNTCKAALLLCCFVLVKWSNAQDISTTTPPGSFGSLSGTLDALRVENKWSSHLLAGTMGGTTGSDKWQATGLISGNATTGYYGRHTQFGTYSLFTGFAGGQHVIDWVYPFNNTPQDLTFRRSNLYLDALRLRGNGSAILGTNSSGAFAYTPMLEINTNGEFGIGKAVYAPGSSAGVYVKSSPNINYTHNTGVHVDIETPADYTVIGVNADIVCTESNNAATGFKTTINPLDAIAVNGIKINIEGSAVDAWGANVAVEGNFRREAYGYKGFVQSADYTYGFFGEAIGNNGQLAYGIYATANNANTVYAGYFDGDVYTTGSYLPSDKKLKENIVATGNVLNKLKLLQPVDYTYIQGKGLHYAKGLQHGFIAQELETIFPELVQEAKRPITENGKIIGYEQHKAINYIGLIAVLTKAIQEQQTEIEKLKAANTFIISEKALNNEEQKILDEKAYSLSQNTPNPFTQQTTIHYNIPKNNENAMIAVFDLNGKMLLQFNHLKGSSAVTINANTLPAGMYLYSLLVNGKEIITKKMILTK